MTACGTTLASAQDGDGPVTVTWQHVAHGKPGLGIHHRSGLGHQRTLTAITVSPSTLTLPVGGSEQMTATGSYSDGSTENLTNSVVWSSSAPTVATVSTTGKVQVSQIGSAAITASLGTTSGTSAVTGTSAVITSIVVSPAGVTLAVGQTSNTQRRQPSATAPSRT